MKLSIVISIMFVLTAPTVAAKEFVVRYEQAPWETNKPYLEDAYTKDWYTKQTELDIKSKEALSTCKVSGMSYTEKMDCLTAIDEKFKNPIPKRGSKEYIEQHYTKNPSLNGIKAPQLKALLESLVALRAKTRQVTIFGKPENGELTFEQVNKEICEIERVIGFVSSGRVCIR